MQSTMPPANMSFGDVLLFEAQESNPVSDSDNWPAEILEANYHSDPSSDRCGYCRGGGCR